MEKSQTLQIKIPKGFEVDSFDHVTGELKFKEKPKSVFDCINTDEDVLKDHGLTMDQFLDSCKGLRDHEIAGRFIELIVESLNEDWEVDDDDPSQSKYEPIFTGGSRGFRFHDYGHWRASSFVGSRLALRSSEHAKHAGTNFTSWYKRLIIRK